MTTLTFPQFRRYKKVETYFRIDSPESFEEIRGMGKKWLVETHTVKILPDRNFIHDLLFDFAQFAEEITSETYYEIREKAARDSR